MSLDPRANSLDKLTPPAPLPYVSRKALKRVTNPLPVPTECPYCASAVRLVSHGEIYGGREYGDWPYAYLCRGEECGAYVGLHPNTDIPLGTLADQATRKARLAGKDQFIALQHRRHWSRKESYAWLAKALSIEVGACHWGWFDEQQAERAGELCRAELAGGGR